MANEVDEAKQALRTQMRAVRKDLLDRPERSARMWKTLTQRPDVLAASKIMVFDSIAGEPDTAPLIAWCETMGKLTCLPEDADLDPAWPDVIIIPGLAFTVDGKRCGQGGGWYDRFLPQVRPDAVMIGVCFAPQIVAGLPTDKHDVVLDAIVTD
ncbi:5-formyltetrahydrofolate cyclo-ligase [Ilumatobacter sp.]|uniref:5-formyltetrahydrofolate cyclo-ligase n=1 Tax=Ilumatobacter sp. TaxID=1967498 RepID=UPI0037503F49